MTKVAEIQAAVEGLSADERLALFHWLEQDETVQSGRLAALRASLAAADDDFAAGRFTVLEADVDFDALATEVKRRRHEYPADHG